jgi:SAM-dependent methyltransferase
MIKRLWRNAAEWPWRLMPRALRSGLLKAGIFATARQQARPALIALLELERVISGQIDLAALEYGDGVHVKHRLMRYHDFFVDRIKPGERVLDVGCGYGAVANSIAARAQARVTGIDLSADNVAQARRSYQTPGLEFLQGEAPGDLKAEHFDVIVLSNVLEHVKDRDAFLAALRDKTTPSRLLIRVPMFDREWRVPLRQELGLYHFSDPTHHIEYTRETFEAEMAQAGLAIEHLQVNWGEIWAEVRPRA